MKYLILALFALCTFDTVLTDIGLTHRYISERNPIMHFTYYKMGVVWFYVIKMGLPLTLFLLYKYKRIRSKIFYAALTLALFVYLAILPIHLSWVYMSLSGPQF